jgi:hypothetical protein
VKTALAASPSDTAAQPLFGIAFKNLSGIVNRRLLKVVSLEGALVGAPSISWCRVQT